MIAEFPSSRTKILEACKFGIGTAICSHSKINYALLISICPDKKKMHQLSDRAIVTIASELLYCTSA